MGPGRAAIIGFLRRSRSRALFRLGRRAWRPLALGTAVVAATAALELLVPADILPRTEQLASDGATILTTLIQFLGVATLAVSVSVSLVTAAVERYRGQFLELLTNDDGRNALMSLIVFSFTITIGDLVVLVAGARPAIALPVPILLSIATLVALVGYVGERMTWFHAPGLASYMARELVPALRRAAPAIVAGQPVPESRQLVDALVTLASGALDGGSWEEAIEVAAKGMTALRRAQRDLPADLPLTGAGATTDEDVDPRLRSILGAAIHVGRIRAAIRRWVAAGDRSQHRERAYGPHGYDEHVERYLRDGGRLDIGVALLLGRGEDLGRADALLLVAKRHLKARPALLDAGSVDFLASELEHLHLPRRRQRIQELTGTTTDVAEDIAATVARLRTNLTGLERG